MAKIKKIKVSTIAMTSRGYSWVWKTFKTFTDDNGNETYFIDGREVTKDDGNKEYLELKNSNLEWRTTKNAEKYFNHQRELYKKSRNKNWTKDNYDLNPDDTFKRTVEEETVTYEELIDRLEKSIDPYVEYIDDYTQYMSAKANNEAIYFEIAKLKKLIEERK